MDDDKPILEQATDAISSAATTGKEDRQEENAQEGKKGKGRQESLQEGSQEEKSQEEVAIDCRSFRHEKPPDVRRFSPLNLLGGPRLGARLQARSYCRPRLLGIGILSVRLSEFAAVISPFLLGESFLLGERSEALDNVAVSLDDDIAAACHAEGLFQLPQMVELGSL